MGVKKEVSTTRSKLNPSIPKLNLTPRLEIHGSEISNSGAPEFRNCKNMSKEATNSIIDAIRAFRLIALSPFEAITHGAASSGIIKSSPVIMQGQL